MALEKAGKPEPVMRIVTLYPNVCWDIVWTNLHEAWISNTMKITWHQVIHDIVPTNERLARIRLCDAAHSRSCARTDTILHRLTECNAATNIWEWTRARMVVILRTSARNINPIWTIRPDFHIRPP
jgi:hypothetical protein